MTLANKAKLLWQSYGKTSEIGKKSLLFSYFRVPGKFGTNMTVINIFHNLSLPIAIYFVFLQSQLSYYTSSTTMAKERGNGKEA